MKKISIMLLATLMLFAFVACEENPSDSEVKTATVGEWKDSSTVASQRTPMDFTKGTDGSITLKNAENTTATSFGGVQADVTMDENSTSWTVETTVTLPTGTDGMNIGLWTDSDYSTANQYRTDGILAAVYDTNAWVWMYYDEDGTATGTDGQWKTFTNADAPKAGENDLKIEYSNGKFTFSANDKVLGTLDSDANINNDRLQTIFFMVKNLGTGDTVKFTAPSVTYLTK